MKTDTMMSEPIEPEDGKVDAVIGELHELDIEECELVIGGGATASSLRYPASAVVT